MKGGVCACGERFAAFQDAARHTWREGYGHAINWDGHPIETCDVCRRAFEAALRYREARR